MPLKSISDPQSSVKMSVANALREEIISGRLEPGERVVEGRWAAKLGVAQSSIREALNLLISEGFVEKGAGRSARVTKLSDDDVGQIYEMRLALECLAARRIAEHRPDLSELDQAISDMRSAADCNNVRAFFERDIRFHLLIAEKSGNQYLAREMRRLIVPLFAFVVMRVRGVRDEPERWKQSIAEHQAILEALRSGDPGVAEAKVAAMNHQFYLETHELVAGSLTSVSA